MPIPDISKKFLSDIALSGLTSMKVGGPAKYFFEPTTLDELSLALKWSKNSDVETFIMGQGTNLIVGDLGFKGLVVRLGEKYSGIRWKENTARVKAGELLENLVRQSVQKGFSGMEHLIGIPGSVGGAVCMNAGAFDQTTSDIVASVLSLQEGKKVTRTGENLRFGYRNSIYRQLNEVIVEANFKFTIGDTNILQNEVQKTLAKRQDKQPCNEPCAGSIFKRPLGYYAGTLIEQAGLKGKQIGGAKVSQKHAGFIVNTGNATAKDIRALISVIVETVEKKSGIHLETEVVFVGDF